MNKNDFFTICESIGLVLSQVDKLCISQYVGKPELDYTICMQDFADLLQNDYLCHSVALTDKLESPHHIMMTSLESLTHSTRRENKRQQIQTALAEYPLLKQHLQKEASAKNLFYRF